MYSKEFYLDSALVFSVIKVESGFNLKAKSPKGAVGLMQILPSTAEYIAKSLGVKNYDLYNVDTNIRFGCYYLRYLINKFTGLTESLCAYNAGEGNVRSWLKDDRYSSDGKTLQKIPFSETNNYVNKIYKSLDKYKKMYRNSLTKVVNLGKI